MKNRSAPEIQTTRRILPIACATLLAAAMALVLAQPALAARVTPPAVPANIAVPAGHNAFLVGHAIGTQNYICSPSASSASGVAYVLLTPRATLFTDEWKEVTTHYFSPNPSEPTANPALVAAGTIRATWQHSRDTSTVWAKARPADPQVPGDLGDVSSDPTYVAKGAIAWVKLTVVGAEDGPDGAIDGETLIKTTFIQRLNTTGGVAPTTGCASPSNIGNQAFVPYTADYYFYQAAKDNPGDGY